MQIKRKQTAKYNKLNRSLFMKKLKFTIRILLLSFIIFINIGCDQVTKKMAQEHLPHQEEITYLDGRLKLIYAENTGAFLSFGDDWHPVIKSIFLIILPSIALILLIGYTFFSKKITLAPAIAFSFLLGGGISNVFDRIAYGKVVDFLNLSVGHFQTGIFNMADVAIMTGMFWMIVVFFRK